MLREPIIAGTDGSSTAERAVDKAGEIARALGAEVHVVSCFADGSSGAWKAAIGGVALHIAVADAAQEEAEQIVQRARARLAAAGIMAQTHVCTGDPAASLITMAEGLGAQMIVVGNRGLAGARWVLGSVTNRVSHQASCGVLIVPTS